HRAYGQALYPPSALDMRSATTNATPDAVRRGRTRLRQWRCHLMAASHTPPTPQDRGVLRFVIENVQQQTHDALLTRAEFRDRFDTDRIMLRGMVVDGIGSAMRFEYAIGTLRSALRERRRNQVNRTYLKIARRSRSAINVG